MSAAAELILPAARWSPPFDQHEFVLQERTPLEQSEYTMTQLARAIEGLGAVVRGLELPGWNGVAADSYRSYLAALNHVIGTMSMTLANAAGAIGLTIDNIDGYQRPIAVDATDICNSAQIAHDQLEANRLSLEAAGLPSTTISFTATEIQMAEGLARGALCQQGVQQALEELASSLLFTEEAYSYLTIPKPPSTTEAVLVDIFTPVQISGVTTGQTPAAEAAFANLTGRDFVLTADLRTALEGLTPQEREWVLDHVPSWLLTAIMLDSDLPQLQTDYEWFAQNLPLDQVTMIAGADPHGYFRPLASFPQGPQNVFWAPAAGGKNPSHDVGDLVQGAIGDCHLLAALGAITTSPQGEKFFEENIKVNENGTYSVTLYDSTGVPFHVTVLPEVVASEHNDGTDVVAYAQPAAGSLTAYQIYEKAVAQASAAGLIDLNAEPGGYNDLHVGSSAVDLPILTGQDATLYAAPDMTARGIQVALAVGLPVTVGTFSGVPKPDSAFIYQKAPAGSHAYYVTGIDMEADPPAITLSNPWGPGQDIVLTIGELQTETANVTIGSVR